MKAIKDMTMYDGIEIRSVEELNELSDKLDRLKIFTKSGKSFRNVDRATTIIRSFGSMVVYPSTGNVGSAKSAYKEGCNLYEMKDIDFGEDIDHYSQRLIDFHTAFDSPVLSFPQIPAKERALLRVQLLQEELDELKEGIENEDLVECADAITDLMVVLEGTIIEFGMQKCKLKLFDEVMDSNMSKLDDFGHPIINGKNNVMDPTRPLGKILKSKNFFEPRLKPIIDQAKTNI